MHIKLSTDKNVRLLKNKNFNGKKLFFQLFFKKVGEVVTSMPNLKHLETSYEKSGGNKKCSTSPGLSFDTTPVQK